MITFSPFKSKKKKKNPSFMVKFKKQTSEVSDSAHYFPRLLHLAKRIFLNNTGLISTNLWLWL